MSLVKPTAVQVYNYNNNNNNMGGVDYSSQEKLWNIGLSFSFAW